MSSKFNLVTRIGFWWKLVAVVLVIGILLATVSTVGAAWYTKNLDGTCSGGSFSGQAKLTWNGYSAGTWGRTQSQIDWWNGGGWTNRGAADSGYVYGGTNQAQALVTWYGNPAGYWSVGGWYAATFPPFNGGWVGPEWWNTTCS